MSNEELVKMVQEGKNERENMLLLWQQNHGLIYKTAQKFTGWEKLEDLVQEAYFGLYEAVRHYKPDKGMLFAPYMVIWIKQRLVRYMEKSSAVKIPINLRMLISRYRKIKADFQKQECREPEEEEMLKLMEIDKKTYMYVVAADGAMNLKSLDAPIGDDGEETLGGMVPANCDDWDRGLDLKEMEQVLDEAIGELTGKSGAVIKGLFFQGKSREEIAKELEITQYRVSELKNRAFKEFRTDKKNNRKLKSYYETYLSTGWGYRNIGMKEFCTTWTSQPENEVIRKWQYREDRKSVQEL